MALTESMNAWKLSSDTNTGLPLAVCRYEDMKKPGTLEHMARALAMYHSPTSFEAASRTLTKSFSGVSVVTVDAPRSASLTTASA